MPNSKWKMTHVSALERLEELAEDESGFVEVLDEESVTVDIGRHTADTAAAKNPHNEDELYYIISGSGKLRVGDEVHSIESGDTVFVEQGLEHDFFDIEEDIVTLAVFADSTNPTSYSIRE